MKVIPNNEDVTNTVKRGERYEEEVCKEYRNLCAQHDSSD